MNLQQLGNVLLLLSILLLISSGGHSGRGRFTWNNKKEEDEEERYRLYWSTGNDFEVFLLLLLYRAQSDTFFFFFPFLLLLPFSPVREKKLYNPLRIREVEKLSVRYSFNLGENQRGHIPQVNRMFNRPVSPLLDRYNNTHFNHRFPAPFFFISFHRRRGLNNLTYAPTCSHAKIEKRRRIFSIGCAHRLGRRRRRRRV